MTHAAGNNIHEHHEAMGTTNSNVDAALQTACWMSLSSSLDVRQSTLCCFTVTYCVLLISSHMCKCLLVWGKVLLNSLLAWTPPLQHPSCNIPLWSCTIPLGSCTIPLGSCTIPIHILRNKDTMLLLWSCIHPLDMSYKADATDH